MITLTLPKYIAAYRRVSSCYRYRSLISDESRRLIYQRTINHHNRIDPSYIPVFQQSNSASRLFSSKSSSNSRRSNLYGKTGILEDESSSILSNVINRFSDKENFAALWQAKGIHYVSYDNLVHLNELLTSYNDDRTKAQKKNLLNELTLTYFARFHNMIREEYQFEKKSVEDRMESYSKFELQKQGYALFNLNAAFRGFLFKEKVYRFTKDLRSSFGYNRFSNGDVVRISKGNPMSDSAVDGIILNRRSKYIDICVPASVFIDTIGTNYRLDAFFNRASYERMLKSLQLFLETSNTDRTPPVARGLRDLLMYSYPNSMIMLARTPGGLKMALPSLTIYSDDSNASSINNDLSLTDDMLKSRLEQKISYNITYPSVLRKTSAEDLDDDPLQLAKSIAFKKSNRNGNNTDSSVDILESKNVMTVADALNTFKSSSDHLVDDFLTLRNEIENKSTTRKVKNTNHRPVFSSNKRLRQMAEQLSGSLISGVKHLTIDEIRAAYKKLSNETDNYLNPSQLIALEGALQRPLSLIQGPPGTGKTRTAAMILATLVKAQNNRFDVGGQSSKGLKFHKILACAFSNIATDNLVEWLIDLGVKVVRVGRPASIRSKLWNHTLDSLIQSYPDVIAAKENLQISMNTLAIAQSNQSYTGGNILIDDDDSGLEDIQKSIKFARKRLEEAEKIAANYIIYDAEIVVSTCIGAGSDVISDSLASYSSHFSTVLIDEAAQCSESAVLPTIVHGCEKLILVGDQNQLPPFVNSPEALKQGLGISLFARLCAGGLQPYLLSEQYRMHPSIALFSSDRFYGGKVKSKVVPNDRPVPLGIDWPNPAMPVLFMDVSPSKTFSSSTTKPIKPVLSFELMSESLNSSYLNLAEANVVMDVIEDLISGDDIKLSDIGVISPYNGQVRELINRCRIRQWIVESPSTFDQQNGNSVSSFESNRIDNSLKPEIDVNNKIKTSNTRKQNPIDQSMAYAEENFTDYYTVTAEDMNEEDVDDHDSKNKNTSNESINQNELEIKSVDGFQGREKEVIILSTVRSNTGGVTGFLKDWRRLNVAITRARSGLIVIGDANVLSNDEHWKAFIEWCQVGSCYRVADLDSEEIQLMYQSYIMNQRQLKSKNVKSYYDDNLI